MRLHNHIHELGSSPAILCAIGYTSSLLAIVKKDSILAQRNIPWSIGLSLQKIMTNLGPLDHEDKAKALLKSYGLIYDDRQRADQDREVNEDTSLDTRPRTLYQILTPDIDELIHEFHELIGYVRSGEPSLVFDKIYLYGQAALIRHLSEYIERRINIPAEIIDPLSHEAFSGYTMPPEISESSPFALALGLAMRKVTWL
jgi:Tfp pilus assembly PilM family ATPase